MNDDRRKLIENAIAKIAEGRQELEQARDEEQEYLDNMPENMQFGEKGEKAQTAIDNLQTAIDECESAEQNAETGRE